MAMAAANWGVSGSIASSIVSWMICFARLMDGRRRYSRFMTNLAEADGTQRSRLLTATLWAGASRFISRLCLQQIPENTKKGKQNDTDYYHRAGLASRRWRWLLRLWPLGLRRRRGHWPGHDSSDSSDWLSTGRALASDGNRRGLVKRTRIV